MDALWECLKRRASEPKVEYRFLGTITLPVKRVTIHEDETWPISPMRLPLSLKVPRKGS